MNNLVTTFLTTGGSQFSNQGHEHLPLGSHLGNVFALFLFKAQFRSTLILMITWIEI